MSVSRDSIRIGPITCVTVVTPDLKASETAYGEHLGYRVVGRGRVSLLEANLWQTPAAAGAPYLLMAPKAGEDFVFRFIADPAAKGHRAFTSHGWHAAELIVDRVDPLAEALRHSPFEIIAEPLDLSFNTDIRAMQLRGAGGEILYLTEFKKPVPGLPVPPARCQVDRTFIVIVGGKSLPDMQQFYSTEFGVPEAPVMESRVQTMALEFGLSREHRFKLAAVPLRGSCYIEVDEMPAEARPLPEVRERLPLGIAMVTFQGSVTGGQPTLHQEPPYQGASTVRCMRGAAGELLEIVKP